MKYKVGKRIGKLVLIKRGEDKIKMQKSGKHILPRWVCKCDCGNYVEFLLRKILRSKHRSCGCSITPSGWSIHGMSRTRFYRIWAGINSRCKIKNNKFCKYHGGRGIKCIWKSFEEFKKDMYKDYVEHVKKFGERDTTIERIDNNGNYYKNNCRWATILEQNQNKRGVNSNNIPLKFIGILTT